MSTQLAERIAQFRKMAQDDPDNELGHYRLGQLLLEDGQLWRLQLDTYEREVERYGGPEGMVLAERLFQADSEAVLEIVEQYPEDARGGPSGQDCP